MKSFGKISILLGLSLFFVGCETDVLLENNTNTVLKHGDLIPNQYIVVLNQEAPFIKDRITGSDEMSYKQRTGLIEEIARELLDNVGLNDAPIANTYGTAIVGFTTTLKPEEKLILDQVEETQYLEQDRIVALAPPPGKGKPKDDGGSGGDESQSTPWGITEVGGKHSGVGKRVWIIDTGVDQDHRDLNVSTTLSATMFKTGKDAKTPDDGNGHGTHVAGTVAALDNNVDVVGIAAGAEVVGVKVLDSRGSGSYSIVIAGVDYVAANAASRDVANMSLGGPASASLDAAVVAAANKGIYFSIAAGNDASSATTQSPARVNHDNVWTVSAYDNSGKFASFSNYDNPPIDLSAPGVSIPSLWKNGGTRTISGTSMAAPHVAGVLIITSGAPKTQGNVTADPDGNPDAKVSIY